MERERMAASIGELVSKVARVEPTDVSRSRADAAAQASRVGALSASSPNGAATTTASSAANGGSSKRRLTKKPRFPPGSGATTTCPASLATRR